MCEQRKTWKIPQLIILAKGAPEESVLTHCKTMNPNQAVEGPADLIQQSTCAVGYYGNCSNCKARANSGS